MNIASLKTLLQAHPEITGSDDARAAALNALTQPGKVPYAIFQPAMMQMACWGSIRVAANKSTTPDAVLGLCFVAIDLLTNYKGESIDMSLPAFQAAMGGLVQSGLVSTTEQAEILALANNQQSVAAVAGLGVVAAADIAVAEGRAS